MSQGLPDNQENLRWEYRELAFNHRFYVGLRFVIAAFAATFQSALLKFYSDALLATNVPDVLFLGYWFTLGSHPISIAAVGLITTVAIFAMERRNINRIGIVIKRGKEVEFELFLAGGQFSRLESKGFNFFTYTWSLSIIYLAVVAMWIWLLFFNLVAFYERTSS